MLHHRLRAASGARGGSGGGDIPTNGLVAWYTMDNISSTTLIDETGNYDATINGASMNANGTLEFTSPDYIETGERFDFIHQTCNFTWNTWLNCDFYNDGNLYVFAGSTLTGSERGFWFGYEDRSEVAATSAIRVDIYRGVNGSPTVNMQIDNAQPLSGYAMVTIQGDGSAIYLYVNNQLLEQKNIGIVSTSTAKMTVNIGRSNFSSPLFEWDGSIGETAIYNRPLNSQERQILMDRQTY